ncbi:MAG: exosome complex protein Rrp42 [Candidatus Thermoplasmatota archaeon]|jgi:exosome complex component RRP42|nr:exosome complex protein Rrp42 [Candidatus Thermoplasmatota archaeon]
MPKDEAGVLSEIKKSYIINKLKEGKRGDGRSPLDFREIKIFPGYVPRASGSARVELGKTKVVAGVKIESGEPFPDTPDSGVLTTNVELLPMAFPTFESGPPGEGTIELARVVDRGIRESKMIDMDSLVITPGEKVWIVFVDIDVLDFDGNLIDACTLAAVSALRNAVIPGSKEGGKDTKLVLKHIPISVTMSKIGDVLVCDPDTEEEQMGSTRITVTTTEDGHIRAMQKGEVGYLTMDEVKTAINNSLQVGKTLREKFFSDEPA